MAVGGRSRSRARSGAAVVLAAGLIAGGCKRAPALPEKLTFEGQTLEKGPAWNRPGVSGVVFIPPESSMPLASPQVGIALSAEYNTAAVLNDWIMDLYRRSPTQQYYESVTPEGTCKIGLPAGPLRPFVAVHVCRDDKGYAACAEYDERLPDADLGRCLASSGGTDCWATVCTARLDAHRSTLQGILIGVLHR
jgi:hypothetical protein